MPNMYDSLLLNYGGGIINQSQQSKQYSGSAALAIGIGGTGTAALAELKRKIYQQLIPDNPDSPTPRYDHIQLLAIDSDEDGIKKMRGKSRLDISSEFFSIYNSHLKAALAGKSKIESDPRFNWMDIDRIDNLLSPEGAGGVRQVGRFLLISKAQALYSKIAEKCTVALSGMNTPNLDVYIFAGISGGTGSGCFLDTCYIVRQVLEDKGWKDASKIMGFFFLPDVVTSKKEVRSNTAVCQWNNSNGYAAMKELDYLMDLKCGNDHLRQNYGAFRIDTQEPPVDMCHLVSAIKADGSVLDDGFSYCINVAGDYVMAYLADVALNGVVAGSDQDKGLTMRGHLANLNNGVSQLSRDRGACRSYHVLGASNAEIPMTQIATYLAVGFDEKFQGLAGREKFSLTKADVNKWASTLGLTFNRLSSDLQRGCQMLMLPDIDKGILRKLGAMPKGQLPQPWATPGNAWCNTCAGTREKNRTALNGKLENFDASKAAADSLLGKVFRQLCSLAKDPSYGPYYAAALLDHQGYDLFSVIDGTIKEAEGHASDARLQLQGNEYGGGMEQRIVQASTDFCNPKLLERFTPGKLYEDYKNAVEEWYRYYNMAAAYDEVANTLRRFREDLKDLRRAYFEPMIRMLDTLHDTFKADKSYLDSDAVDKDTGYTWRILNLSEIKKNLDKAIDALTPNALVANFLDAVMSEPDEWLTGDDGKVSQFISKYMFKVFQVQMNRSLEDYLFERFPAAAGDVNKLTEFVQHNIIQRAYDASQPMFWCSPQFDLGASTFPSSSISVPSSAAAICAAANNFQQNHGEFTVRPTGLQDRIFSLRFCSGVPLYAYQGITLLKSAYDQSSNAVSGVGAHLYSKTGRGEDGTGSVNWRTFLPVPMPYSENPAMDPTGADKLQLYKDGVSRGVIYTDESNKEHPEYFIRVSRDLDIPHYTAGDFMVDQTFQENALDKALQSLQQIKDTLYDQDVKNILLRSDGDLRLGTTIVENVRKDYFIHYPRLQEIVKKELDKYKALDSAIENLEKIRADRQSSSNQLKTFCDLIFFKLIRCEDSRERECYDSAKISKIKYDYLDSRNAKQSLVFSERDMPYGTTYPLYQAFLTYCSLDPNGTPRRDLDKQAAERAKGTLHSDDNWVAYQLECQWNSDTLHDLERHTAAMKDSDRIPLVNFYYDLYKQIESFKEANFTDAEWRCEPGTTPATAPAQTAGVAVPPAQPNQTASYFTLWNSTNNHQLTAQSTVAFYAWDPTENSWVLMDPKTMQVYNTATGAWAPLQLNAQGFIVL